MSEIPKENNKTLQKRRDAVATTVGEAESKSNMAPPPPPPPPVREMPRRNSSAKELIAKFERASVDSASDMTPQDDAILAHPGGGNSTPGAYSSSPPRGGSSISSIDALEQRIQQKQQAQAGAGATASTYSAARAVGASSTTTTSNNAEGFETRYRRKVSQESLDSRGSATADPSSSKPGAIKEDSNTMSEYQQRITSNDSLGKSDQLF